MKREVFSQFNPPPFVPEKGGGELCVERVGFQSSEKIIKGMLQSGKSLMLARSAQYDVAPGKKGMPAIDPLRRPGVDDATVSQMAHDLDNRLKLARQEAKRQAAEKAAVAGNGVTTPPPDAPSGEG